MSETTLNGGSALELTRKVDKIKKQIQDLEEDKKDSLLMIEREKAKLEMYKSQLKELGYEFEGISEKIVILNKEVENAVREAESILSEAGISL